MMKKISAIIPLLILCLILTSCVDTAVKGDPRTFANPDRSLSIELPAKNDKTWVIAEDAPSSILDISDADDTVNILVQCISYDQAEHIASDLEGYSGYALEHTLGGILTDAEISDAPDIPVPDIMTGSIKHSFTMKDGIRGFCLFMESGRCYYTYFVMAVDKAYSDNEDMLLESVMSLKEVR